MSLTAQQIEVLARFEGFVIHKGTYMKKIMNYDTGHEYTIYYTNEEVAIRYSNTDVLIRMRMKIMSTREYKACLSMKRGGKTFANDVWKMGELILSRKYTAAAAKASELIKNLEV